MACIKKYFENPHESSVINTKLLLLCRGVDVDFESLRALIPDLKERYKTSKSVVSYRHLEKPGENSDYYVDELLLSDADLTSIVKTYISAEAPVKLCARAGQLGLWDKGTSELLPVSVGLVPLDGFSRYDDDFPEKNLFLNRIGLDRIGLLPFVGCELWLDKKQCHFCGSAPKALGRTELPNLMEVRKRFGGDYRRWWQSHRESVLDNIQRSSECLNRFPPSPHFHFMYMSENLADYDMIYEIALDISSTFGSRIPLDGIDSYFNAMPPASADFIGRIKNAGYRGFVVNMEFIRKEDFDRFCPGKATAYPDGFNHMMRALEDAVDVFGRGNVRTNFVLTSEQVPALTEGIPRLSERGIVSDVTVFFPRRVSRWRNKKSPSMDEVLAFSSFLRDEYLDNGFHPYCCSLSSRSSVLNELCAVAPRG